MTYLIAFWMAFAAIFATVPASAEAPNRIKIGTAAISENGCSSTAQVFKIAIPRHEQLDLTYRGVLNGVEIVQTQRNGRAGYANVAIVDGGSALTFQLHAQGAGTRIRSPFGGGSVCHRAEGANVSVEVYVYYRA